MISDPEKLHAAWQEWVHANLGRDSARSSRAADAAIEAALRGAGFAAAADVARRAWLSLGSAAGALKSNRFPAAITTAMHIAMAGAVASTLLAVGLGLAYGEYIGPFAVGFVAYNLVLLVINSLLLSAMHRGAGEAWILAVILVSVGIGFDVIEQGALFVIQGAGGSLPDGPLPVVAAPGSLIAAGVGFSLLLLGMPEGLALGLTNNWMAIHIVTIQLPILIGLLAGRSWFRASIPAIAAPSGSDGTLDAAF